MSDATNRPSRARRRTLIFQDRNSHFCWRPRPSSGVAQHSTLNFPLHSASSIHIRAPRERIFTVVSDLARWPELLPHYRYIRTLGSGEKGSIVQMSATRSGIPITWVSEFWADPRALELHFVHLRKWTKGMRVVWTLTPTRDGTRVEIVHDLKFRVPFLRWLAEPIIGGFFIENVANKTLATFKKHLESAECQVPGAR